MRAEQLCGQPLYRSPLRFDANGDIHPDIIKSYSEYDFYILEGVLSKGELADIKTDLAAMRENFGFHKRSSVLNVCSAGMHAEATLMDANFIDRRARLIGLAIDARAQRFPDETPYTYAPFAGRAEEFVWSLAAQAGLKDYNLMDLSI